MPKDERVLVISKAHFENVGFFRGFRSADDAYYEALLHPSQFSFRPRSQVETDPSFLQLIPYVVLQYQDQVFHYRRGKSGSEARLRALRSIGIGGHISEEDADGGADPFVTGLMREVTEEVDLPEVILEKRLGLIFDDSTPVGQVHLGVAVSWHLQSAEATPREDCLADAGWENYETLKAQQQEFETWSQLTFDYLFPSY